MNKWMISFLLIIFCAGSNLLSAQTKFHAMDNRLLNLSTNYKLKNPSATELLTQKSWTPVSYGYDHNASGLIDASEESIRD